jgi:hypothetical protein
MKAALQEWLTPEEPEEGTIIDEEPTVADPEETGNDLPWEKPAQNYTLAAKPAAKANKFDALFEDEE